MIQVGIFRGYFPYDLDTTARNDPRARLQHRAARPALQGHRPVGRPDHRGQGQARARHLPRQRPADLRDLGLHQHRAPRPRRAQAPRRLPQGDHPQRPLVRHAVRDLRVGHLQRRERLGARRQEQDRRGLRRSARRCSPSSPRRPYDHGSIFLLETYVNNVIGSRAKRPCACSTTSSSPGIELLMDPTNYFETPQHRQAAGTSSTQVFDTLGDRVRVAHAKDVKRSGDDKSEKHADIGDERRARVAHLPRRRRDRAARRRPRRARLRAVRAAPRRAEPERAADHRAPR